MLYPQYYALIYLSFLSISCMNLTRSCWRGRFMALRNLSRLSAFIIKFAMICEEDEEANDNYWITWKSLIA